MFENISLLKGLLMRNGLPESVVLSNSVNGFKNALDKYFKLCGRA